MEPYRWIEERGGARWGRDLVGRVGNLPGSRALEEDFDVARELVEVELDGPEPGNADLREVHVMGLPVAHVPVAVEAPEELLVDDLADRVGDRHGRIAVIEVLDVRRSP